MSWAEIKKAVNSNLNKALDVLINEKFTALNQLYMDNYNALNSRCTEIISKTQTLRAQASNNVRVSFSPPSFIFPSSMETPVYLVIRASGTQNINVYSSYISYSGIFKLNIYRGDDLIAWETGNTGSSTPVSLTFNAKNGDVLKIFGSKADGYNFNGGRFTKIDLKYDLLPWDFDTTIYV